jgi:hypothetical protein
MIGNKENPWDLEARDFILALTQAPFQYNKNLEKVNGENSLKICLWQNTGCILLCTESVY